MSPQQKVAEETGDFVNKLNDIILFPLIALLSAIAFLVFIYGLAVYVFNSNNETARSEGKKHIMYGIIGLVVMISAYTLLSIASNTFGMNRQLDCADNFQPGCEEVFKVKTE
ncbi:MAG: hypothetical protein H6779_04700 [Candidatus Nomurabacteria bacterium]|nr:hypothetical protein [Candidatus Nomurabacteria bacterium]USN87673.1 MAG: hypothetical protein H6779_04700 [Candidatus Nomurabacteria bacterium]